MLTAIYLNNQFCLSTIEVYDIALNRFLSEYSYWVLL